MTLALKSLIKRQCGRRNETNIDWYCILRPLIFQGNLLTMCQYNSNLLLTQLPLSFTKAYLQKQHVLVIEGVTYCLKFLNSLVPNLSVDIGNLLKTDFEMIL